MVNKSFLHNPHYFTTTHRTYSEATRDAQYACSIYSYQADLNHTFGGLFVGALIIGFGLLVFYIDPIIEAIR